jgi:alpha-beta hydrolase superfamily lysophospholipase
MKKIETKDGHDIKFIEQFVSSNEVVLLCHGITSEKNEGGTYTAFAKQLQENKISSFRFDFRGHGSSEIFSSEATVAGMIVDLYVIITELSKKYKTINLVAASFGASVTLLLLQQTKFASLNKICLWNPVTDYASTFTSTKLPWGSSFFPQTGMKDAIDKAPIKVNDKGFHLGVKMIAEFYYYKPSSVDLKTFPSTLIMHGKKDTIVSYKDSEAFAKGNKRKMKLQLFPNGSHGLEEDQQRVFDETINFFKS